MSKLLYEIVVAVDNGGGFAKNKEIPWLNEDFTTNDMAHFKKLTTNGICIMGRNTYEDMANIFRTKNIPIGEHILSDRISYVLTTNCDYEAEGAIVASSLRAALDDITTKRLLNKRIFVIGGFKLFIEALPFTSQVHMTVIDKDYNCDTFFPISYIRDNFKIINGNIDDDFEFIRYVTYVPNKFKVSC